MDRAAKICYPLPVAAGAMLWWMAKSFHLINALSLP